MDGTGAAWATHSALIPDAMRCLFRTTGRRQLWEPPVIPVGEDHWHCLLDGGGEQWAEVMMNGGVM